MFGSANFKKKCKRKKIKKKKIRKRNLKSINYFYILIQIYLTFFVYLRKD